MRIDFVITELFVGGAERCLTELATGLDAGGDQVRVFSIGSLPTGPQRVLVDRLELAGIEVCSCGADTPRQFAVAYRRLRDGFRDRPPDICQSFLFHGNVLGTWAAQAAGVPLRIGGIRVVDPRPTRRWGNRWASKRMQAVVCVSAAVERFAQQRLGFLPAQTRTIPNGVNVPRFATAIPMRWSSIGWPDDAEVVLFVGRLHPQKGIELLQRQIDSLAPPASKRRLLLVGDGPLRKSVAAWTDSIGHDRVRCLPWQSDVAPWMRGCRVLVLPSRYEGMPNVVLEAMAAGRPVVCSNVEGSEELLQHAYSEQVFPAGDHVEMKQRIERFLQDQALRDRIGIANQTRARNDYSLPAMVAAYRDLYRSLLAN
jgi:glycosyltransferase involved in cell wall biosynthesis